MKRMGIEAIYRRPNTSKPAPGHKIYPYLLRKLPVTRPNQVWAMDITYIPMARGFVYLAAVVDWFSRRVLAWRLSITMDATSASRRWRRRWPGTASRRSSTPIRAASSPAEDFTAVLKTARDRHQHGRQGRLARQRLRRAALAIGQIRGGLPPRLRQRVARPAPRSAGISAFYNARRPHSSLDRQTPDQAYFNGCRQSGGGLTRQKST